MKVVAIAGRPNVGKSSLFNRLTGRRRSLVWNEEGVTRDLLKGQWVLNSGGKVEIWDLAGWGKFGLSFQNLDKERISSIDLILMVVDGSEPLTSDDYECLSAIRRMNRPLALVINKADKKQFKVHAQEILKNFSGPLIEISAEQGRGISELDQATHDILKLEAESESQLAEKSLERVLILGRPNVGKSSLLNVLAGETISFVSDQAGTTRDLLEVPLHNWLFVDSAGVRKKSKIYATNHAVEIFSTQKALKSLRDADACLFVVEAQKDGGLGTQDKKLLKLVRQALVPTIVVVNKFDIVRRDIKEKDYREELRYELPELAQTPILFVSAKTGFHVTKVFQLLTELKARMTKIPTSKLNQWLKTTLEKRPPRVAKRGKTEGKLRTATQYIQMKYAVHVSVKPMTFQIFCNAPQAIAEEDKRFLTSRLREDFQLTGLPLRLIFRRKK